MNFKASASFKPASLSTLTSRIRTATRLSVDQGAHVILDNAINRVPVDTGELLASGGVTVTDSPSGPVGTVTFAAGHAAYVEYGTGVRGAASPGAGPGPYSPGWAGMAAQPYLRPAFDESKPDIIDIFKRNTELAVKGRT